MAEPFRMNTINMDVSLNKTMDGNNMTITAGLGNSTEGCNMGSMDGSFTIWRNGMWKESMMVKDGAGTLSSSSLPSSSSLLSVSSALSAALAPGERMERKAMERRESDGKESDKKEMDREKDVWEETEGLAGIFMVDPLEWIVDPLEWTETERKEADRKEMERKEKEREVSDAPMVDLFSSETVDLMLTWASRVEEICEGSGNPMGVFYETIKTGASMIKAWAQELVTQLVKATTENARLKQQIGRMNSESLSPLCERGSMTERKETERKDLERKELGRKETEREEKKERKETIRKKKIERKETERKETKRKESEKKESKRKETERKEMERKESKRKESERTELERKELERKDAERKESERRENKRKELERKEMERKELERKEGSNITSISPFLIGEDFPLPPSFSEGYSQFYCEE